MPKDCGLTPNDRTAVADGNEASCGSIDAALVAASLQRRRYRMVIAWGAALLMVIVLAAWLARRGGVPIAVAMSSADVVAGKDALPPSLPQLSLEELLAANKSDDWRMTRLSDNTAVLVIEFPNLLAQGLTFNRVAALIEKRNGARLHALTDPELAALVASTGDNTETFYQGHDYTGVDLARFFSLAASQPLSLNAQESRLRSLLLQEGVMREQGPGNYAAISRQAVISFSAVQADNPATPQDETIDAARRVSVLLHEFSHGHFFTRPDYQKTCWKFWNDVLDDAERQQFRTYLAMQNYDAANEELMVNEVQALLMHTPDSRAFNAAAMGVDEARLKHWRRRFSAVLTPAAAGIASSP